MSVCVYCAVGPEIIGHYDVSDTHSEQEQQLQTLSGQWVGLDELNPNTFFFLVHLFPEIKG